VRVLVWLRSDLRVTDNPALYYAREEADRGIIAVFLVSPGQWREHQYGGPKVDFVLRSLAALKEELKKRKISLIVKTADRFDDAPRTLLSIARDHDCDAVYFNEEYEVDSRRRDDAVQAAFEHGGRRSRSFHDQTGLPPASVRTSKGTFYTVFTQFRRAWIDQICRTGLPRPLPPPSALAEVVCPSSRIPSKVKGFACSGEVADLWPAGEEQAAARLTHFLEHKVELYHDQRERPGSDGTSRLSPYFAAGVLSVRQCLEAAVGAAGGGLRDADSGPATWISELIWREFYRHVLVGFPRVGMGKAFLLVTERVAWRDDEEEFEAWCEGRTGVPIVDAGMRELAATGWMHNRVRMTVAMFLAKHLLIDWRRGEQYFLQHLVDADFASNNGGWQWAASTGVDAAPYFRIFNPYLQGSKFDREGEYIRRWIPEFADVPAEMLHDPALFTATERSTRGYPEPLVDHAEGRARAIAAFKEL
jgi:deoxyribodipyrimidine photo-lyase